jgi:hypothetical protein
MNRPRSIPLLLAAVLTGSIPLLSGCDTPARAHRQGLELTQLHQVVASLGLVAVPSDGHDLAAALGRQLEKRGLRVQWLPAPTGRPQDRWPDAGAPIDTPMLQLAGSRHQADALLEVRSSQGYDGVPLQAQVRLIATAQQGQAARLLSEVNWRNRSLGDGPGSTLDRLGRKDPDEAALEIVPLLLEGPPPPVR